MKILWICFVWPEPTSSAAGYRTLQLIEACLGAGYGVDACSPCQSNVFQRQLEDMGVRTAIFPPNDSAFDSYIKTLNPDVVFFDRFIIEEQFSWRVKENCPQTARILDTCDLHSLRRIRQKKIEKEDRSIELSDRDLQSDDALREIASIYRSDLSLIISDAEMDLLVHRYNIMPQLLELCRFFYPSPYTDSNVRKTFEQRANFIAIGNFNHPPNRDSVHQLHGKIWPNIRNRLKKSGIADVELHIYGAYPTTEFLNLDNANTGFRVKGWADDVRQTFEQYRVNLAPLRFGAGIKGKISDGWFVGTPCIATSIAAEGMQGGLQFGGVVEDLFELFAEKAASLYCNSAEWQEAQKNGYEIISGIFDGRINRQRFLRILEIVVEDKTILRERNFIGAMLWHHQLRSTEFFSRWIEAKNHNNSKSNT